jgi:hypothetical protein
MLGCVAALVTLGSPFDSAKAEAAALRTCAEDGPMMHASTESIPANAEPSVLISGVETWSEYRQKTDRTYVDEKGEIQPLYQLLRPEKGHVYLHVVAYVATDSPRSWATDEILVVDSVGAEPEWQAAPLAAFDEQGIVRIGAVTAPSQKVALDLMYEVPAGSWPEFYLKIDDQSYGPFHEYQELAPVAASAASALF